MNATFFESSLSVVKSFMKNKTLLFFALLFCIQSGNAQKLQLFVTSYSGVSVFKNNNHDNFTDMYNNPYSEPYVYSWHPYGKTPRFSWGAEGQMTFAAKKGLLFNLSAGYEELTSTIGIDTIYSYGFITNIYRAEGRTTNRAAFITIFPSLGYRLKAKKINIDMNAGIVVAACLSSREKGRAAATSGSFKLQSDRKTDHPSSDIRPSLQAMLHYKKLALVAGYQWGLKNYYKQLTGANPQPEAFSRFLKLGISYRVQ